MAKPNRREDFLRRERTRNIVILALIVVAIFVCSTDVFKDFTSHLFGTDKEETSASSQEEEESPNIETGDLTVYCIDVEDGTSTLIRVPEGDGTRDILIDAGDSESSDKLLGRLEKLGISYIDTVICAHKDSSSSGGMSSVLENFTVRSFYVSGSDSDDSSELSEDINLAAASRQLRIQYIDSGSSLEFGDAVLSFTSDGSSTDLDYSLEYNGCVLSFTGDPESCVSTADESFSTADSGIITITIDDSGAIKTETSK